MLLATSSISISWASGGSQGAGPGPAMTEKRAPSLISRWTGHLRAISSSLSRCSSSSAPSTLIRTSNRSRGDSPSSRLWPTPALIRRTGQPLRALIRDKEPVFAELGLADASEAALFAAVTAHPVLLNRPIVVTKKGAKLCRPGDQAAALL